MNLVNGRSEETRQAPVDEPWAQKIKRLFPLKINRFAVHNGEIHYRDFSRNPKVNMPLDRVQMVAVNLTNSKKLSKSLIADIRIEGRPMDVGDARSQISLDPYAARLTFAFNLEAKDLPLVKLNNFAKAYGNCLRDISRPKSNPRKNNRAAGLDFAGKTQWLSPDASILVRSVVIKTDHYFQSFVSRSKLWIQRY